MRPSGCLDKDWSPALRPPGRAPRRGDRDGPRRARARLHAERAPAPRGRDLVTAVGLAN